MKKYWLLIVFIVGLYGCSDNLYTEGNYIFENKLEQIKVGMSKEEIFDMIGPHTIEASFNENIVYYIYETSTRKLKFLSKNIIDSKVIKLTFDNNSRLVNIDIKTEEDRKRIPLNKKQTPNTLNKTKIIDRKIQKIDTFN